MKTAAYSLFGAFLLGFALLAGSAKADLLPAVIGGNCGSTSQVFSPWGDPRDYYLTADGGFEGGGIGWTFSNAKVVQGNDPYYLGSRSDSKSLLISSGGSALSPSLCFGLLYPGIRFMAMSPTGSGTVQVKVIAHGVLGVLSTLDGGTYPVGKTWAPTEIAGTLFSQLNVPVGTKSIQIQLIANGSVQVDDLYIDPFIQR